MKKFAISFKGGLARGFGAIGVMKFLQEENLRPDIVAGSSSGSMIAASIALDFGWQEILNQVTSFRFRQIVSLESLLAEGSLVSYKLFEKELLKFDHNTKIEDLPIKLVVFATDPIENERVFIEKGSLVKALIASSGFPLIFPSVKIEGKRVLDGDLSGGFSARDLRRHGAKVVLGVCHKRIPYSPKKQNIFTKITETYQVMHNQINILHDEIEPVDLTIKYDVGQHSFTNFKGLEKIVNAAYEETKKKKYDILKLLKD